MADLDLVEPPDTMIYHSMSKKYEESGGEEGLSRMTSPTRAKNSPSGAPSRAGGLSLNDDLIHLNLKELRPLEVEEYCTPVLANTRPRNLFPARNAAF